MKRPLNESIKTSPVNGEEEHVERRNKRPRTSQFLEARMNHENMQASCSFFQQEIENLRAMSNIMTPYQSSMHQTIATSLEKELSKKEEQFESYHQSTEEEVHEKLQLDAAYKTVEAAVDGRQTASTNSPLNMLDQGVETNTSILNMIASFAGVPSVSEFQDLQELALNLQRS
jgi:hypothetical protein